MPQNIVVGADAEAVARYLAKHAAGKAENLAIPEQRQSGEGNEQSTRQPEPACGASATAARRPSPRAARTFHEYASYWLQAKTDGVIGDRPIDAGRLPLRLRRHLLPLFGPMPLEAIDRCACGSRRPS